MDIKVEYEPDIGSTEFVYETVELPIPSKNISLWSNSESKLLIDLYKNLINEVGPLKRFRLKRDMWNEISLQIPTKTSKQCEERFKTLLKRKKNRVERVSVKKFDSEVKDEDNKSQIFRKYTDVQDPFKQVNIWNNNETKLLMELHKRLICEVGLDKRFMHKKDMWHEISTNFVNKDANQCQQRYHTVLKRKKKGVTRVYISKSRRKLFDFKGKNSADNALKINRLHTTFDNDPITNHTVKIDNKRQAKEVASTQKKSVTSAEAKEVHTISETLLKIAAKREEGKERRHREKMEAIQKVQNMLQQILNSKMQ